MVLLKGSSTINYYVTLQTYRILPVHTALGIGFVNLLLYFRYKYTDIGYVAYINVGLVFGVEY